MCDDRSKYNEEIVNMISEEDVGKFTSEYGGEVFKAVVVIEKNGGLKEIFKVIEMKKEDNNAFSSEIRDKIYSIVDNVKKESGSLIKTSIKANGGILKNTTEKIIAEDFGGPVITSSVDVHEAVKVIGKYSSKRLTDVNKELSEALEVLMLRSEPDKVRERKESKPVVKVVSEEVLKAMSILEKYDEEVVIKPFSKIIGKAERKKVKSGFELHLCRADYMARIDVIKKMRILHEKIKKSTDFVLFGTIKLFDLLLIYAYYRLTTKLE